MYPRLRMRLSLTHRGLETPWRGRTIEPSDVHALGALMHAAYRETVDDEGESETDAVAEVERTFAGEYGPLLVDASLVVEEDQRILGASLVTLWEDHPFLAYAFVHPDAKRRGIATLLVASAADALLSAGYSRLDLFVTEANEPAVNLYRKLGFQVVDRLVEPPRPPVA